MKQSEVNWGRIFVFFVVVGPLAIIVAILGSMIGSGFSAIGRTFVYVALLAITQGAAVLYRRSGRAAWLFGPDAVPPATPVSDAHRDARHSKDEKRSSDHSGSVP